MHVDAETTAIEEQPDAQQRAPYLDFLRRPNVSLNNIVTG